MRVKIFISMLYKLYREKIDTRDFKRLCAFLFADYSLCYTRAIIGFFLYILIGKLCKCRSPPFYQFEMKKQIDRRNERWQNALKEENIRIILIH